MIKALFASVSLALISSSAFSAITASNFDNFSAERIKNAFELISGYSSVSSSNDFKIATGADIGSGKDILKLISGAFPVFAAGNDGLSFCLVDSLSYCDRPPGTSSGSPKSFFVTKGSSLSLWLPYKDIINSGSKKGYILLGQDKYLVSDPGALVPVFNFQYTGLSSDAVAIIDLAYLAGFSVVSKRMAKHEKPIDICSFATKRFQCDSSISTGYFFVVSLLISELSKKCTSCTQKDYIVLSYLFSINALSAPANKHAFLSGVEAMRKNEDAYNQIGLDLSELRYRYHFGLTK